MKSLGPIVFLSLIVMVVIVLLALFYIPTNTSYSIFNDNWNGLSRIVELGGTPLLDYESLFENPSSKALLIISQKNFTEEETSTLIDFIRKGGYVIVLSEHDNLLLDRLGGIRIIDLPVLDSLYYYKSFSLPVAKALLNNTNISILLNIPKSLEVDNKWTPFIITSRYSFTDINGNGTFDSFEERKSHVIGAYRRLGLGKVFVIADLDVFINSMLELYNNSNLIQLLRNGRELCIDLKHIDLSPVDNLKTTIYFMETRLPRIAELLLVLAIAVGYYLLVVRREGGVDEEKVLRRYGFAVLYISLLAVITLLFEFDYILVLYIVALSLLFVLRNIDMGLVVLTSMIMYLSRTPLILSSILPLIIVYPLLYYKQEGLEISFLGPTSTHALRVLSLLLPIAIMRPIELIPVSLLILSVLIWSTREYLSTGKVLVSKPKGVIEAVLNEEVEVLVNIKSTSKVYVRLDYLNRSEEIEVQGDTLIAIPLVFSRLGYHRVDVDLELRGLNRFSRRYDRIVISVNVIPSIRKLLRIIESSIGITAPGGGLGAITGRGPVGEAPGEGARGKAVEGRSRGVSRPSIVRIRFIGEGLSSRSVRGEYYGVREFVPGDNPRNIHWKKSLAKGELVVKEFSSGLSGAGGTGSIILFADLISSSVSEFDKLSYRLLTLVLRYAAINPYGELVLFLTLPDNSMEVLRGEARSILVELYKLFKRELIYVDHEYYSMSGRLSEEEVEAIMARSNSVLNLLKRVNAQFYASILTVLGRLGFDNPTYYTVIHGRPTSFKYSILRYLLGKLGYVYVEEPRVSFREASMYTSVLASVL